MIHLILPFCIFQNSDEFQNLAETVSTPKLMISDSDCAVAAESEVVVRRNALESLLFLISLYYTVSIEYPKSCNCTFTYVQKEIFQIPDSRKVPAKLVNFVTKLGTQ